MVEQAEFAVMITKYFDEFPYIREILNKRMKKIG